MLGTPYLLAAYNDQDPKLGNGYMIIIREGGLNLKKEKFLFLSISSLY